MSAAADIKPPKKPSLKDFMAEEERAGQIVKAPPVSASDLKVESKLVKAVVAKAKKPPRKKAIQPVSNKVPDAETALRGSVKFPLELSESLRIAVKRRVIDLRGVSMNSYIVESIRMRLEADGIAV